MPNNLFIMDFETNGLNVFDGKDNERPGGDRAVCLNVEYGGAGADRFL